MECRTEESRILVSLLEQGVLVTDEANGIVGADAIKLVPVT